LVVLETSEGPDTLAAYGSERYTHKLALDLLSAMAGLTCTHDQLASAVEALWHASGERPSIADLMDALDLRGVHYSYAAWSDEGDALLRH
jgi:hypothetical protein